jgi:hypothetical protein
MKDLTGKGKPFHSALDKAAALLKRKVGTGQEFMQELKGLGGIKQAEIEERKLNELLGMPKMTHDQFLAELGNRPVPAIKEKVLGEEPSQGEVIKGANAMARQSARNYSQTADTSREAREMMSDELRRLRAHHRPQMQEAARRDLASDNSTWHDKYTLPGGENYREMLIKAPAKYWAQRQGEEKIFFDNADEASRYAGSSGQGGLLEGQQYFPGVQGHFNHEPNILASMRLKDRTGPNGEKLLHLEELQSDWHQQGREKGYRGDQKKTDWDDPEYAAARNRSMELQNEFNRNSHRPDRQAEIKPLMEEARKLERSFTDRNNKIGKLVPDAPFKKNWEEMALKRLIHHAAEKGYHGIVVTPGKEQADRYSLAKHIDDLHYSGSNLVAYDPEGNEVIKRTGVTPQELPEIVGKELADKLMAQEPQGTLRSLRGVDLEVGGEGMKGFYDKKVPNILNAIGKKHGVKTQLHGHQLSRAPKNSMDVAHYPMGEDYISGRATWPEMLKANPELANKFQTPLHHFPITEDMRKDILTNGLPLYQEGGIIRKAEGGNVQLSIEQMRQQLSAFGKPMPDISQIGANEAPAMPIKNFVTPEGGQDGQLPIGGVDMSPSQPGQQLLPASLMQPNPQPQPEQPGQPPQGTPSPLGGMTPPPPPGGSNILQMTPQGQALNAMKPPAPLQRAQGGPVPIQNHPFQTAGQKPIPFMAKVGGSNNMPMDNQSMDNGATTFDIDNIQELNGGGQAKPKKPTVQEQKDEIFRKAQEGLMKPSEVLGKHEGKYLHMTEADRAKVEKRLHGMRGGVGFSQIGLEDPEYAGRVWGVGKSGTAIKLLNRQRRGLTPEDKAIWTTFIGTPEMHTSNQLVFNRMWNKFQAARKAGLLSPEQEEQMLDIMRSAMTKGTEKNPAKPIFEPDTSFDNTHHLFDTFERRRILSDLMAGKKVGGKKAQIFDASKMIEETTDPRLLHAPTLSVGPHVFSFSGETSHEPHLNKAFPFMLHGETSPDAFRQIPFTDAAPDFTNEIRQAKGREPGYMDIVRRIPRQHITEKYLTALQKRGYKNGGKVKQAKLSDNLDTMRLALTKNSKKVK